MDETAAPEDQPLRLGEPAFSSIPASCPGLRASARAAPSWSEGAIRPHLKDPARAFAAVRRPQRIDRVSDGALLCQVELSRKKQWDETATIPLIPFIAEPTFGRPAPDIRLMLGLGALPKLMVDGPLDSYTAVAVIPHACLSKGESISADVVDRDLTEDESAGSATATFAGSFPLTATLPDGVLTCGWLDGEQAAELARAGLAAFDRLQGALSAALHPDPQAAHWGYPEATLGELKLWLEDAAAFIGWAAAEVQQRTSRVEEREEEWLRLVARSLAAERAGLAEPGGWVSIAGVDLAAKVDEVDCRGERRVPLLGLSEPAACEVKLLLKNHGTGSVDLESDTLQLGWVDRNGRDEGLGRPRKALPPDASEERRRFLEPGEEMGFTTTLEADVGRPFAKTDPLFLRLKPKKGPSTLLRVF